MTILLFLDLIASGLLARCMLSAGLEIRKVSSVATFGQRAGWHDAKANLSNVTMTHAFVLPCM
jgi:hypothetical protein